VNVILGLNDFPWVENDQILFIGNSYTYYNGGIDSHVYELANNKHDSWDIYTDAIVQGGATLQDHWNNETTREAIQSSDWDFVVLQEQSTRPIDNPDLMLQYAALLDSIIVESGAQTVFFMTWAREWDPSMIEGLEESYTWVGQQLDATVAPVGLAFESLRNSNPEIQLYAGDGSHPNNSGTYLSACVFYSIFWNESTEGSSYYMDNDIPAYTALILQSTAWETVQNYLINNIR